MKLRLIFLSTLALLFTASQYSQAQEKPATQAELVKEAPTEKITQAPPPLLARPTNAVPIVTVQQKVEYAGLLPMIRKKRNFLQLINPFAPATSRNIYQNVSIDPATGQPQGISLFSIKF